MIFFLLFLVRPNLCKDMAKLVNILEKEYPSVKKLRLSYVFGKKNILLPFNPVDARSDSLLKQFPSETIKNFRKNVNAAWEEVLIWAEGVNNILLY